MNKIILLIRLTPLNFFLKLFLNIEIPKYSKKIKLRLPHPYSIIINRGASIGINVTILQGVQICSNRDEGQFNGVPIIGDNVVIFPNSVLVGKITIGQNAIIGAGSVVVRDVPPYSVVAGNPAKILRMLEP